MVKTVQTLCSPTLCTTDSRFFLRYSQDR